MATVKFKLDPNKELTRKEKDMIHKAAQMPYVPDEDVPEFSDAQIAEFRKIISERNKIKQKQTVSLRLSNGTLSTAKALGKSYTTVLSTVLENVLDLLGDTMQGMLEAEMDEKLGYSKYDYQNKDTDLDHCKTPESTRYVLLSRDAIRVYNAIIAYKKATGCESSPWLFDSTCHKGSHIHSNAPRTEISKINKVLNMPYNCSMHDCRRTYASISYLYAKAPIKLIQRQLGHKQESQTWAYIKDIGAQHENEEILNRANYFD